MLTGLLIYGVGLLTETKNNVENTFPPLCKVLPVQKRSKISCEGKNETLVPGTAYPAQLSDLARRTLEAPIAVVSICNRSVCVKSGGENKQKALTVPHKQFLYVWDRFWQVFRQKR